MLGPMCLAKPLMLVRIAKMRSSRFEFHWCRRFDIIFANFTSNFGLRKVFVHFLISIHARLILMLLNLKISSLKDNFAPFCMVQTLESERVDDFFHSGVDRQPWDVCLVAISTLFLELMGAFGAEQGVDALGALDRFLIRWQHRVANSTLD